MLTVKECPVCGQIKSETEFHIRHRNKDGTINLQGKCKECHSKEEMARYYLKQEFIDSHKTPCAKCGEKRIRCISFHHKDPDKKDFTIGRIGKSSLDVIKREISKCVCLCLNCHYEFHYLNNLTGVSFDEYLDETV